MSDALPGVDAARGVARLAKQVEVTLAEVDLSLPQYRMLALLSQGTAAASALAGNLAISRPTVTAIVDGLVQRGLVTRHPRIEDRRRVDHALTDAGRALLTEADHDVEARLADILGNLPDPSDRAAAAHGLRLCRQALDNLMEAEYLAGRT